MTTVGLDAISYRHGVWHQLAELLATGQATAEEIKTLRNGGLARYSVLETPMRAAYADCVGETLDRSALAPTDIDAVVFFSSTFASYEEHEDLIELCRAVGMQRALPIGVFLAQCTNFSYALLTAQSLIQAQGMSRILLLGADRLDERRARRVLAGAVSVFSDGIVSAVVGSDLSQGYVIEHIGHRAEPELSALDPQRDVLRFIDLFAARLGDVTRQTRERTGLGPEDFSRLILANLAIPVLRNYAAVAEIPFRRVPADNLPEFGHCFSHDQFTTLDTERHGGGLPPGDRALLLGVGGNHLFSATAVRLL